MISLVLWNPEANFEKTLPVQSESSKLIGQTGSNIITISSNNEILLHSPAAESKPRILLIPEPITEISTSLSMALFLTRKSVWLIGEDTSNSGLFTAEGITKSNIPVKLQFEFEKNLVSASISSHHAAVANEDGEFFTWGEGFQWELGRKENGKSGVKLVETGNFFKAKQVICTEKVTGVVTQGGYLYWFGKKVDCKCGGASGYPYSVPALENHFVSKSLSSGFGIVLLTDVGKTIVAKGCLCTVLLGASKSVSDIASLSSGICGLSKDGTRLFYWTHKGSDEWQAEVFKTHKTRIKSLYSGHYNKLVLEGSDFNDFPYLSIDENLTPEISPKAEQGYRKSFEQLLGKYSFEPVNNEESESKQEGCKALTHLLVKYVAESFRKIKEFSYAQKIHRNAFASLFISNLIGRIIHRFAYTHKTTAFRHIVKFVRNYGWIRTESKIRDPEIALKLISSLTGGSSDKLTQIICRKLRNSVKNLITQEKFRKAFKNPFEISLRIVEKHNFQLMKRMFETWSGSNSVKKSPVHSLCHILSSHTFKTLRHAFLSLKRPQVNSSVKYGLYIFSSFISKSYSKLKCQSFNTLLRHQSQGLIIETMNKAFSSLVESRITLGFNHIKLHALTQKYRHVIYFVLKIQSQQEKIKYRSIIKGFNAFKQVILGKPSACDLSSEQSFNHQEFYKFFVTPQCGSPTQRQLIKNTDRLAFEKTSATIGRRASLHNFQKQLVKKVSEKISNETKSNIIKQNKVENKKTGASTALDKRNAYYDLIRQRQRKKISSTMNSICSTRKGSFMLNSFELNPEAEVESWKRRKYLMACNVLVKVLERVRAYCKRLNFNYLKYDIVANEEEVHAKVLEIKKNDFINHGNHKKRLIELHINVDKSDKRLLTVPGMGYESPIISPIARLSDETFSVPPSPFTDLMSPRSASVEINGSLWKLRLIALGFTNFSRIIKSLVFKQLLIPSI